MSQHPRTIARTHATTAPVANSGSQTILHTESQPRPATPSATLRLRAESEQAPRVRWAEDVVDNEGMGKKSSKVCCIYHKPNEPGDSDSDSSSSSSSDSDSEPDLSRARRAGANKGRKSGNGDRARDKDKGKAAERKPSPNAYERQPNYKSKMEG